MNTKSDGSVSRIDMLLWSVVVALLVAGVWANFHYSEVPWALRFAGWIVLVIVCGGFAFLTAGGKKAWQFGMEARGELRKVTWPTRQETIQTTMVVIGLVILVALILWGVDSTLLAGVSWFTR